MNFQSLRLNFYIRSSCQRLFGHKKECRYFQSVANIIHTDKAHIEIRGVDTKKFLQGICTNDINKLDQTINCLATAFLSTKGRVIADAFIFNNSNDKDDIVIVETDKAIHAKLLKFLSSYKLRSKVSIKVLDCESSIWFTPPTVHAGEIYARDPRSLGMATLKLCCSSETSAQNVDRILNSLLYTRYRYLHGLGEGHELTEKIPLEMNLDLLNYISFTKGCYVGQELIARTKHKGLIRKRLVPFFLAAAFPEATDEHLRGIVDATSDLTQDEADLRAFSFSPLSTKTRVLIESKPLQTTELYKSVSVGDEVICEIYDSVSKDSEKYHEISTEGKAIGEVIAYDGRLGMGLALMRLESLFSRSALDGKSIFTVKRVSSPILHELKPISDHSTVSGRSDEAIITFRPAWWPSLDPITGKSTVEPQPI